MKVALFVHCFFPNHYFGTEAYTLTVAKELAALGHDPTVVTATFQGEPRQQNFIDSYDWDGIPVLSIDKNQLPHASVMETYDQPAMRQVHERILRKLQPDVIHVCHLINHTIALLDVAAAMNIPVVSTLTDFFGICFTNKLVAADDSLCSGPSNSRANCMACYFKAVSWPDLSSLPAALAGPARRIAGHVAATAAPLLPDKTFGGLRPRDIALRPDAIAAAMRACRAAFAPTQFLKEAYERNSFPAPMHLSHFGIDIDRSPKLRSSGPAVRLGFIGQILPHKGVHLLIEALRTANRGNLSLELWGDPDQDPSYFDSLKRSAASLPVRFAGTFPAEAAARVLADIDALVIPSTWYENSPLVLLQALATHTPVIVSDVLGLTEFVAHEVNGFHFRRGDAAALASVLTLIADHPDRIRQMSEQTAYARTPRDMVLDILDVYRSVVQTDGG